MYPIFSSLNTLKFFFLALAITQPDYSSNELLLFLLIMSNLFFSSGDGRTVLFKIFYFLQIYLLISY